MRTLAVVLALLCGVASAECRQDRRDRRVNRLRDDCGSSGIPDDPGQFVFAPTNGVGMGNACACTTPTGSRGEVLTFTRGSDATCSKGNEYALIANGDLVTCTGNQPRVMPGGDGGTPLGLSLWEARTNSTIRNTAFDNAAWLSVSVGIAAPTVTANHAVAPDGTTSAERIEIPAAGAGTASYIYQAGGCPLGVARTASVYVRGTSGSGTILLATGASFGGAVGAGGYTSCPYVSASWTRCIHHVDVTTSGAFILIGTSPLEGTVTTSAIDALVWGIQCEAGFSASPVIQTAGTTVARLVESAAFPAVSGITATGSTAARIVSGFRADAGDSNGYLYGGAAGRYLYQQAQSVRVFDGTNEVTAAPSPFAPGEVRRFWSSWTGSTLTVTNATDAVTSSGTFDGTMEASTLILGKIGASNTLNGTIKQVCVDPSPTVCR